MLMTTLHMEINNCPEYIKNEAESLISKLAELVPQDGGLSLKLSRPEMFYQADFQIDFSAWHLASNSKSRYLKDALEDSFIKVSGLLQSCRLKQKKDIMIAGNLNEDAYAG